MEAAAIEALACRLRARAAALAGVPQARRIEAVARAAATLARTEGAEAEARVAALSAASGLDARGVSWGLSTTFGAFAEEALEALLAGRGAAAGEAPAALTAAVLAGNVFSAAARPLLLPLACGAPVLAKTAAGDDTMARAIAAALGDADAELAAALAVVDFDRTQQAHTRALLAHADSVTVLGSDEAVAALAEAAPAGVVLTGRGHGLGAAFVARTASTAEAARALSLDVAAYDQRGCLSPHFVLVEGDAAVADGFARSLAEALTVQARELPRGAVPEAAAAEGVQWRGVAAARGAVQVGEGFAVSLEGEAPLRASPGYRHVGVYRVDDAAAARAKLSALGAHLKALGVAADATATRALEGVAPYCAPLGQMQTPPLSARLDGLDPLEGYWIKRR